MLSFTRMCILVVAVTFCRSVSAEMLIDFGNTFQSPTLGGTWNELEHTASGSASLLDSAGSSTVVSLSWTGFRGGGLSNQLAWSADKLWVDADATGDTFYNEGLASVTIAGLNASTSYQLDIVSSRTTAPPEARIADYQVNGAFADSTPNGDNFNSRTDGYFAQEILTWNSVSVDGNGNVVLTIQPGVSSFGYLTAMRITYSAPVPEPTSLALWSFGLVGMTFTRRRRV